MDAPTPPPLPSTPVELPAVDREIAGATPDFDALSIAANQPDAAMADKSALYAAVFHLKEWQFIARGDLPDVMPYIASNAGIVDGAPMLKAFTDGKRLHAFARENDLCEPDGSVHSLSVPVAGFLATAQSYVEQGVTHIHFNADRGSDGFYSPITSLPDIRRYLQNAKLLPPPLPPAS